MKPFDPFPSGYMCWQRLTDRYSPCDAWDLPLPSTLVLHPHHDLRKIAQTWISISASRSSSLDTYKLLREQSAGVDTSSLLRVPVDSQNFQPAGHRRISLGAHIHVPSDPKLPRRIIHSD